MKPVITDHAYKAMKKRSGLSRKKLDTLADEAFNRGLKAGNTVGALKRYCELTYKKSIEGHNQGRVCTTTLYKNFVFIFIEYKLITMYSIPGKLQKDYVIQFKKQQNK